MKHKNIHLLAILLASITVGLAQEISSSDTSRIQQVIIQENRFQIPVSKNSRNIEVLTKEDIQKLPARTINEVLSHLNGVDLRQRGPFGTQADISIDGGSFEQTLVLLNGVKISDPQTGHHNLNLPIPLEAIERIEVLRGPVSRIYGVNGLTGSINIVTKAIDTDQIIANVYSGSSFKDVEDQDLSGIYYGYGLQVGGQIAREHHEHQLYFTKESSNGQRYNSAVDNYKAFYQNQIKINESNSLNVLGGYINNNFGANGYYAAPGDIESQEIVQTAIAAIGSNHKFGDRFHLAPRVSYRFNKDDYRYFRNDLSRARSLHENQVVGLELNGRYRTNIGDIGIGAESRFERIESSNIGDHTRENHGYYAEFRTEHIRNFIFNVGTYINYNTQYGWQVFPGIDASYIINSKWRLAVNTGSSQRIPSFTDLYLNQRPGNIGNPNLTSENAWQAEGLLKYNSGGFTAQAGYFYRNIRDFIDWQREDTSIPYQPFNIDNNKMRGYNVGLKYKDLSNRLLRCNVAIGYNYLNPSVIANTGGIISKYAIENLKHQLNTTVNLMYKAWSFTTTNRFIERASSHSYVISDLRLAHQLGSFTLYADIQNALDKTYVEAGAVPMPGRWYTAGVRYNWIK